MPASDSATRARDVEARIRDYHGVDLHAVHEVISYLREPDDSAILGGSLALGLGNQRSDLDIVLAQPPETNSSRVPLEHWVETLRVDVWKLTRSQIDEVFVRAEEGLASQAPFEGAFGDVLEQADLKLLHRIAFGIHLDGPPLVPSTRRDYREIARDLVRREYAERMRESAFVAQLAVVAGHRVAASSNARVAVEEALHATLAARGVPFTGDKWLGERLEAMPELAASYDTVRVLPDIDADPAEFVDGAIRACRGLTGLDLSVAELASHAGWRNTDVQLMPVGDKRLLLSAEQGSVWEIDAGEERAWAPFADAAAVPCGSCDRQQTALAFGLYARGVFKLRWEHGIPIDALDAAELARA